MAINNGKRNKVGRVGLGDKRNYGGSGKKFKKK
jgi:hypothetical protein